GSDGLVMVAVGGLDTVAALLASAQAALVHQAADPIASMMLMLFAKLHDDAWAAVRMTAAGMNLCNGFGQRGIGLGARTGRGAALLPIVLTAFGHFQQFAESLDGMVRFHRVDPCVTLTDGSERMPSVFFKMSRCSRRWRISR